MFVASIILFKATNFALAELGDAAANYAILEKAKIPIEVFGGSHDEQRLAALLDGAAWIVDALLGTGARGEPRPPLDAERSSPSP